MLTSYTIYYPSGETKRGEVDWPDVPSDSRIAEFVDLILGPGRNLKHVRVLRADIGESDLITPKDSRDMFVYDSCALDGLPLNPEATRIYQALFKLNGVRGDLPAIYGVAIVFDRRVWF
jgi:hypothetical protein